MTSLVGQTLNKRYRLEALLGDGGMGTVYRSADLNLERQVAIKLMHSHFARQEEFRARLVQEARTAAQLDHPSIVRVYDFGESELGLFIAMEYVDGGSLRDHLRRLQRLQKYLPLIQCLQIGIQIAEALDYAHNRKIIHRDVKPGNIILKRLSRPDEAGAQPFRALLTDFGLVKLQEGNSLTQSGATVGTPTYMSPEQCEGRELDNRSDLYSLGIVLYELIANRLPFTFQTLTEAIAAHRNGLTPPPVSSVRPEVPPIIDALLERATAKAPGDRFATGAQMADALRSAFVALEGLPTRVMLHQELDILDQVAEPPVGFELQIQTPGHQDSVVPLTRSVITLGRNLDNDIVLPADGVSRHHTRLQATSLGWEAVDMGGVNGTWLNEHRLRPEEPTPLSVGSVLRIGPYEMILLGPEAPLGAGDEIKGEPISAPITPGLVGVGLVTAPNVGRSSTSATPPTASQVAEQPTIPPTQVSAPLALHLARNTFAVDPGKRLEIKVDVENRGDQDDRVSLRVAGLEPSWVEVPETFVTVPPRQTISVPFAVTPPRSRGVPVGRQRLRIEVVSQRYPQARVGIGAALTVGDFVDFEADMEPTELRLPGRVVVNIRNTGNAPGVFKVSGHDLQQLVRFRGERDGIKLQPNQTANIELALEPRENNWFGEGDTYPFDVEVSSSKGGKKSLPGEAITRALFSNSVLYGMIFLLTFACVLGGLALMTNWGRILGIGPMPTATPTLSSEQTIATQQSVAFAQTVVVATQSAAATLTPSVAGDRDTDGLGDAQEAALGTNPDNPDTDEDGLKDGDEVLIYRTDPRNPDSDSDGLRDSDEINIHRTNPNLADTDADGISDHTEVALGTDPLVPNPPTSALPTSAPPTAALPTTAPPMPSATLALPATIPPTWTAIPTAMPTAAPTATWTPSPTQAPTATFTSPPPAASLVCVPVPPVIDGSLSIGVEWPGTPLFTFQPAVVGPERIVRVYGVRTGTQLYFAYLINDNVKEASDAARLYIDTTNNGLDPDSADRMFQVNRNGDTLVWPGIGSNIDGQGWDATYSSPNWSSAVGEPGSGQWVVEMSINIAAELGTLADPFGLMAEVFYSGDTSAYPSAASSSQANTWQDIGNPACP
ncbi:MAG TPA: protein kinase [Promineifilum sp.]|nr:protein kinase [Promineifilum sp.]